MKRMLLGLLLLPPVVVADNDEALRKGVKSSDALGLTLQGLTVQEVRNGSPAYFAGVLRGDSIVRCEGEAVASWEDVVRVLAKSPFDARFEMTFRRKEKERTVKFDLLKNRKLEFAKIASEVRCPIDMGVLIRGTGLEVADAVNGSPAAGRLKKGDVVLSVQGKDVADWEEFVKALGGSPVATALSLRVRRDDKTLDVVLRLSHSAVPTSGGSGGKPGKFVRPVKIGQTDRKYELRVPPVDGRPLPVVVLLHGTGSSPDYMFYHWGPVAGAEAILAAPWGNRNWNFDENDDQLVMKMLEDVKREYNVDLTRIFVSGHSRGGFYTFSMGTRYGDIFAAAGVFAGGVGRGPPRTCARKCPFIFYHGELDQSVPISAGRSAEAQLKAQGYETKFVEEKGGTPNPDHHEMDRQGVTAIWEFFKEHPLR